MQKSLSDNIFNTFDMKNNPRKLQIDALNFIQQNFDTYRYIAIEAPTGSGKSAIARALQIETNAAILTANNILLEQYISDYPYVNYLKGMKHYSCHEQDDAEITCEDVKNACGACCGNCNYKNARIKSLNKQPTIFNPISFYFLPENNYDVIIVDEAHKLIDMLNLLTTISFTKSKYNYGTIKSIEDVINFFTKEIEKENRKVKSNIKIGKVKEMIKAKTRAKRLQDIINVLNVSKNFFHFWTEKCIIRNKDDEKLHLKPIFTPREFFDKIFGDAKVILLSATLPKFWCKQIFNTDNFVYTQLDNPIPKENRPLVVDTQFCLTSKSSTEEIVNFIKKHLDNYPNYNTIVHLTYSKILEVHPYFPDAHVHLDNDSKIEKMDNFKENGGLWLCAGGAEGLDLKDDLCRLNLIPILPYANIADPIISLKNKTKEGKYDYLLNTFVTFLQMMGRSTRGPNDWSVTVLGDTRIMDLLITLKNDIPKDFRDIIKII